MCAVAGRSSAADGFVLLALDHARQLEHVHWEGVEASAKAREPSDVNIATHVWIVFEEECN